MPHRRKSRPKVSLFAFQDIITGVTGVMILIALLMALELVQTAAEVAEAVAEPSEVEIFQSNPQELAQQNELLRQELEKLRAEVALLREYSPEKIKQLEAQLKEAERRRSELASMQKSEMAALAESSKSLFEKMEKLKTEQLRLNVELQRMQSREKSLVGTHHRIGRIRAEQLPSWWIMEITGNGWHAWQVDQSGMPTGRRKQFIQPAASKRLQAFQDWLAARPKGKEGFFLFVRPSGIDEFHLLRDFLRTHGYPFGFDPLGSTQQLELVTDF
jgi:hypothetical protein